MYVQYLVLFAVQSIPMLKYSKMFFLSFLTLTHAVSNVTTSTSGNNQLTGSIPTELGTLRKLKRLYLGKCSVPSIQTTCMHRKQTAHKIYK